MAEDRLTAAFDVLRKAEVLTYRWGPLLQEAAARNLKDREAGPPPDTDGDDLVDYDPSTDQCEHGVPVLCLDSCRDCVLMEELRSALCSHEGSLVSMDHAGTCSGGTGARCWVCGWSFYKILY